MKNRYHIPLIFLFSLSFLFCEAQDFETVFAKVDEKPQFPGGQEEMFKFIKQKMEYPYYAKTKKIHGKVYVTFTVKADGSIVRKKVMRGIGGGCDDEALRVINLMPKWIPGKLNLRPVNTIFSISFLFKSKGAGRSF